MHDSCTETLSTAFLHSMPTPLKANPLRNPGQSLDEKLIDVAFDCLFYITISTFAIFYAFTEWLRLWADPSPNPILWTFISVVVGALSVWKIRSGLINAKNIKQGRDGEKAVGQLLESLRQEGAQVFHDVCADNFNVDHIVIGPTGIFVIETKTWSKSESGKNRIDFDGSVFKKNNRPIEPSPTIQAAACARFIQEILLQSTGYRYGIQPAVTFPGWLVEHNANFNDHTPWVLNPKALVKFIQNSKQALTPDQVNLASYHLSRHIRTS